MGKRDKFAGSRISSRQTDFENPRLTAKALNLKACIPSYSRCSSNEVPNDGHHLKEIKALGALGSFTRTAENASLNSKALGHD